MRRKQFAQLVTALRAELSKSTDPAAGVSDLPRLKQIIGRNYEALYDSYDWPHLTKFFDRIPLSAGQRYYDFPEDCAYDKIEQIVVWWNGEPVPIERGIGFEEYATYDSENDERSDPICKWDVRATATVEQMEVWPVPSSNQQAIQIKGRLTFVPLVDDDDLCRIDDQLVVLTSALELLSSKDKVAVETKLAALQLRNGSTKGRSKAASGSVRMGLGRANRPIYGKSVVRVSG